MSYCPQWGANQELLCLVPLSRSLLRLGLKGTAVTDEDVTRYFHEVHAQLDFQTTTSPLLELDLSAISKEGSVRISNVTVETIVVRTIVTGSTRKVSGLVTHCPPFLSFFLLCHRNTAPVCKSCAWLGAAMSTTIALIPCLQRPLHQDFHTWKNWTCP